MDFFEHGGRGLNVTLPFKSRAFALANVASERARLAGAANFLTRDQDGQLRADNTDGKGLVTDMVVNARWLGDKQEEPTEKFKVVDQYGSCDVVRYTDDTNRWHYFLDCK